tara:strand:+ start:974 stop:5956 length:4983 start_codon:yes stop_codon:yes gene_type:complete
MAKKLVYNYTFDASAQTVEISGRHKLRTLQLITNVTDNVIIYNFADSTKGGTISYDETQNKSTLTLTYDTTSMSDSDELQIFIDIQEDKVEFGETFTDPVSKLRVSNPENLIDTDFEYGLQPTKWETIETVNNVPSVYSRAPGVSIEEISVVNATANSEDIEVTCAEEHGLSTGDPIEVRGLTSRTAEGKYLVTAVPSTTKFLYRASAPQGSTGDKKTAYTTIIPGSFFTGSNLHYETFDGVKTDGANPSTLTVTTETAHGFSTNTSLYITNTVGKREVILSEAGDSAAPDGDNYIDTTNDSLYLPIHGLYNNQRVTITAESDIFETSTGAIVPVDAITAKAAYEAAKTQCETFVTTFKSDQDHSRLYMNHVGTRPTYMYNDVTGIIPNTSYGTAITQEIRWRDADAYYYFYRDAVRKARYVYNPFGLTSTQLYTGEPVDIGPRININLYYSGVNASSYPSNLSNMGFFHVSTPFVNNTYTDFILTVKQVPSFAAVDAYRVANGGPSSNAANAFLESNYEYGGHKEHTLAGTTFDYRDTTVNTYDTTWRWHYGIKYVDAGAGEVSMYVMDVFLTNTTFPNYNTDTNRSLYDGNNSDLTHNDRDRTGPRWHIQALFGLDDGHDDSNGGRFRSSSEAATRAQAMAEAVADALTSVGLASGDQVDIQYVNDNRVKLKSTSGTPYDITGIGTGPFTLTTDQTFGIADDYYTIGGVTTTTMNIDATTKLASRTIEFDNNDVSEDSQTNYFYINFPNGHGLSDGQKVTFNNLTGTNPTGITSGTEYYACAPNSTYVTLAASESDFDSQTYVIGAASTAGTYNLEIASISGRVAAAGTVTTATNSKVVTGTDTRFRSQYAIGDSFVLDPLPTYQYGDYEVGTIASVVSDTSLTLEDNAGITTSSAKHFIDTKINVRADGTFIHRPFDGGVEITAGSSPDSKVIRQTRKYFRYQSGKGIQCSMAINFNPYRPARSLVGTASSTDATITTEYPHGLTVGDQIKVRKAELETTYTPTGATYDPDTGVMVVTLAGHGFVAGETVTLAENSFTFTCAYDDHATNHTYPRETDPAGGLKPILITETTTDTFSVNVGVSKSPNTGIHTFVSVDSDAVTHIDTSNIYNGDKTVQSADTFTFTYTAGGTVTSDTANPKGVVEYTIQNYTDAGIRAGLFDDQNGMFYEYDGSVLYCVRRSSTAQLSGTVQTVTNSTSINGTNTKFENQVKAGDYVVIRGQSYKVTRVVSDTQLDIQPKYRGTSNDGVIVTKTVDTKVPQHLWSIDPSDGTGPSGYNLDINAIQMVYLDYSWYGAGKIRFGFKDTLGHVKYVHEFLHNNRLNEAYMRSGNIPGRYEAFNIGKPSYVPGLFHWGTSVIMDGGFDDDDSYLFTASGKSLSYTNGDTDSSTTNAAGQLFEYNIPGRKKSDWYLKLSFPTADADKFSTGIPLYTSDNELDGQTVDYATYGASAFEVYIFLERSKNGPGIYPTVGNATSVSIGAPSAGDSGGIDLTSLIPLVSLRLAPSVDNNLIGVLGERDIINRMQLKLDELGISVSHDTRISVILNGSLSNIKYENVGAPSLSQYIAHEYGDTIQDGTVIYEFRASGGSLGSSGERTVLTSNFDISKLIDMGNSILGGDGVFPNGPDILTICASVLDTNTVDSSNPYQVDSRISWAESQA